MCIGSSDESEFNTPQTRPRGGGIHEAPPTPSPVTPLLPAAGSGGGEQGGNGGAAPPRPAPPLLDNLSGLSGDGSELCQSPTLPQLADIVDDYFVRALGRADGEGDDAAQPSLCRERSPVYSGWIEKKGDGLIKLFRRRWCEIHAESIYYSVSPGEEVLGKINLSGTTVLVMQDKERPFAFEVSGPDLPRTYVLAAPTEAERNTWVRAISRTIEWCEVESADVLEDWLEALLPASTALSLKDFQIGAVIGRGSFGKVLQVNLTADRPAAPTPERKRWLRENLVAFYRKYRPERLRGVDTIIKHSVPGHENKLHSRLLERYPMAKADLDWLLCPPKSVLAAAARAKDLACAERERERVVSGGTLQTTFAMKVVKKSALPSIKSARMMMAEKALLQSMNHPYIVKLHYAFQTSSKLFLVMTYLGGGDLRTHLLRDKRFSEVRARFYAAQLLLAIDHMHTHGIVYRDLKPQNIVLDMDGHAVLTDLGLARDITESGRAYTFCGTPQYLAPEVLQGSGYKKAVDFWALGVVCYEMLVGATPFQAGDSLHEMFLRIMDESVKYPALVSKPARDFLSQLLEREPAKRLCSAPQCKAMKFFKPISWSDLRARKMPPPYQPPPDLWAEAGDRRPITELDSPPHLLKSELNNEFAGFSYHGLRSVKRIFMKDKRRPVKDNPDDSPRDASGSDEGFGGFGCGGPCAAAKAAAVLNQQHQNQKGVSIVDSDAGVPQNASKHCDAFDGIFSHLVVEAYSGDEQ